MGGRLTRCAARAVGAVLLLSARPPERLTAQVGHPPDRSPFHDIKVGGTLVLGFGYLSGGRGIVGVGPSNGDAFALRFERPLSHVLFVALGAANVTTSRYVVDPTKDSASRTSGPVDNSVAIIDAGLYMLLTGSKSWHGIAPYWGMSAGVALGSHVSSDPSTYDFGTRLTFGPQVGVRWYLARRLSVRADARMLYWRLTYPLQFRDPSPVDSTRALPADGALREWTRHPWLSLGVGWTF
jgi:hypothetical protein